MADLTAAVLGEHSRMVRAQAAQEAEAKRTQMRTYLADVLAEGTHVQVVTPKGAADNSEDISAVILAGHTNINRELIHRGYGVFRSDLGGAEQQAMHGRLGRLFGKYTEEMFFEGDQSAWNPMRYLPTPFHTKLAQERTALSQYIQQEAVGTRMRRWQRPLHDFLLPYLRGAVARVTGEEVIPKEVRHRRDLDTLADRDKNTRSHSSLRPAADFRIRSRAAPDPTRQRAYIQPHASDFPGRFPYLPTVPDCARSQGP